MDYYKAALIVANTIKVGGAGELTEDQFTLMAGAVGVVIDKAVSDEREACKQVCETHANGWKNNPGTNPNAGFIAATNCAYDIGARSNARVNPVAEGDPVSEANEGSTRC